MDTPSGSRLWVVREVPQHVMCILLAAFAKRAPRIPVSLSTLVGAAQGFTITRPRRGDLILLLLVSAEKLAICDSDVHLQLTRIPLALGVQSERRDVGQAALPEGFGHNITEYVAGVIPAVLRRLKHVGWASYSPVLSLPVCRQRPPPSHPECSFPASSIFTTGPSNSFSLPECARFYTESVRCMFSIPAVVALMLSMRLSLLPSGEECRSDFDVHERLPHLPIAGSSIFGTC